ncbi:MAG: AMP-binding protein [bacterium]|nr:AMP-binding protein [bacterium]
MRHSSKSYEDLYRDSIDSPEKFWAEQAQGLSWMKPFTKVKDSSFDLQDFRIRWFEDGTLNASYNCLDRHLETMGDQPAIFWEGDNPEESKIISYRELHEKVCRFSNVLKGLGVEKGDRVTIYLPMIPEAVISMLACVRIGAIHSVVFGGFSPESLADRIHDCDSKIVITADEGLRGGKRIPLKENTDQALALEGAKSVKQVVVVRRTGGQINWNENKDLWYHEMMENASLDSKAEEMGAEDPLFILYTSGSTGKPKGVLHTTGGYLVYASTTHQRVFDYKPGDIYWCTADVGWITGHTYSVYGPLCNGATIVLFEGVPNYPDTSRFWQIVEKYSVNIFYTAPTAIRTLMRFGDEPVKKHSRKSLKGHRQVKVVRIKESCILGFQADFRL